MTEPKNEKGQITLPAPGTRVVVRHLLSTGQATDALGELFSVDDQTLVVNRVRGISDLPDRRLVRPSTEGFPVSKYPESSAPDHHDSANEIDVPQLEFDQTIAPRPEEEIADALRSEPDSDSDVASAD